MIGSPVWTTGNEAKHPGDCIVYDFNGDGVIDDMTVLLSVFYMPQILQCHNWS